MSTDAIGLERLAGRRVGVWGVGLEGQAVLRRLAGRAELTVIVDDPSDPGAVELARLHGCEVITPEFALDAGLDAVVRSAGVSVHRSEIAALRRAGVEVEGLLALWLAGHTSSTVVGVTGTKGKSTTSALCTALLAAADVDVAFGGNIGVPIIDLPEAAVQVIEVSSYQASDVRHSPTIGVLTSLEADHLPWHGGLDGYWHDKLNLFEHTGLEHFVTHADLLAQHPAVRRSAAAAQARPGDVTITPTAVIVDGLPPITLSDAFVLAHNARNLALAVRAARIVTDRVDDTIVRQVMDEYRGLPSRLQVIAVVDGVRFVDDALASNPLASRTGVQSMHDQPLVLLAGGDERDVDIASLATAVRDADHVLAVVLFSRTRERWAADFRAGGVTEERLIEVDTEDVREAAAAARHLLRTGTTLLFSPAAPTPPSIGTYADRSATFHELAATFHRR